jgi:predicted metalloprotease with PDZ domain
VKQTLLPLAVLLIWAGPLYAKPPISQASDYGNVPIQYDISLANPEKHLFHVLMKVPNVAGELTVQMPAWNALYQVRDFSSHVQQVEARVGTEHLPVEKIDKHSWRIQGSGTVRLDYSTYWDEPGPFATQLNTEHAFINPAMILLYVPGQTGHKTLLSISDLPDNWRTASALPGHCELVFGKQFCTFGSSTYDTLADAPIESGKFAEFEIPGVSPEVRAVVHGDKWDKKQLQEALHRICAYELKLMEDAPFEKYTFIVHLGKAAGAGGGGMEHANSTAIAVRSEEEFVNVAAHEFFHLWNVKRIRPASLDPVDYSKEQYTRALWFAEGVTSTYAAYTLVRTGLWSKGAFYQDLSEQISELEARPANRWQSAEQSSLDAWLEKYPRYNRPTNSVSYYTKGQVLGVILDILIRDRTNDERSLDDVLRSMNEDFAKRGRPYRDSLDVRLTAEKVAGASFEDFFRKYVAGAEPWAYRQWLALAGLELNAVERRRPVLGFTAGRDESGALVVRAVDPDSDAARAGLRAEDVITSWNKAEAPRDLDRWLNAQKKGNLVRLTIRRDDQNLNLEFRIGEASETSYVIVEDTRAGEKARRIREGLLRGTTQPVTALVTHSGPGVVRPSSSEWSRQ